MSCCCGRRKIQIPTGIGYVDRLNQVSLLLTATKLEQMVDQHIESVLLEGLVESLDTGCVEALRGEKYAHGNGEQRLQRRGTHTRTAVTTAGNHEFSLHYVENTAANHTTNLVTSGPSKLLSDQRNN